MANNTNHYWVCIIYAPMGRTLHIYAPDFPSVKYCAHDVQNFDLVTEGTIRYYKEYLYDKIEKQGYVPCDSSDVKEALTYGIAEFSKETQFPIKKIYNDEIITVRNIKLVTNSIIPYESDAETGMIEEDMDTKEESLYPKYVNNSIIEKLQYFDKDDVYQISTILFAAIFECVTGEILARDDFTIRPETMDTMKKDMYNFFYDNLYPCVMNTEEQEIFFGKALIQLRTMIIGISIGRIKDLLSSNDLLHDLLNFTVDQIDFYTPKFNTLIEKDCKIEDHRLDRRICNRVVEVFKYILAAERTRIKNILYPNK